MADSTAASSSIVIIAPVETIKEILYDVEKYPEWIKDMKNVNVLTRDDQNRGKHIQFTVDAKFKKITYTINNDYGDMDITTTYVEGDLDDVNAKYTFEQVDDDTTKVNYEFGLELSFRIPGVKSMITKQANKTIIKSALKDLKKRAESMS